MNRTQTIFSILIHSLLLVGIFFPTMSYAQNTPPAAQATQPTDGTGPGNTNLVTLTQLPGLPETASASSLPAFLNQLYKICIGAAAVIAVLEIMVAGVQFMTSKGSVSSNEAAKSRIQNAVLGLVLVLSPTIVFGIINPDILKLNLDFSKLSPSLNQNSSSNVDTEAAPIVSSCNQAKAVTGTAANACSAVGPGYSPAKATCCAGMTSGNTCCSLTSTQNYMLAWYYTKETKSTKYKCYVSSVASYGTTAQCSATLQQAKTDLAAQSKNNTNWSTITVVKNCELTTETAYVVPAPDNLPKCPV